MLAKQSYFMATILLGFAIMLNLGRQKYSLGLPAPISDDLNLELGLAQPELLQQTAGIERILADELEADFALTEQVMGSMNQVMESFAKQSALDPSELVQGKGVTLWLKSRGLEPAQDQLIAYQASELDFIFATFWSQLQPLIKRIIVERPPQLGLADLAFRCEQRAQEIGSINELARKSSLYRIFVDVFQTELYTHCLRRKLASLRLHRVEPPTVVRQLVDVYLEIPLEVAGAGSANFKLTDRKRADHVSQIFAHYGQNFNLDKAISRYGSIEQAVGLMLLTDDMLSGRVDESKARSMVLQFKEQCARYTGELIRHWGNFDQVATILSSETNNLSDFNDRLKYAQPQLLYASICNQLTNRWT